MSEAPLSENERALWRQETRDFEQEIEMLDGQLAALEAENAKLREQLEWLGRKSLMDKGMEP